MRLSEKTIELNICSQISERLVRRILWFGLTQIQEAKAGFDAATRFSGQTLLFQFKTPEKRITENIFRFALEHDQLQRLITRSERERRKVFYVLPTIETTIDLHSHNGNILKSTWLLDVARLPTRFPLPVAKGKSSVRRSNIHYAEIIFEGKSAEINFDDEKINVKLLNLQKAAEDGFDSQTNIANEGFIGYSTKQIFHEKIEYLLDPDLKLAVII